MNELRPHVHNPDAISFFVAANDQDLLVRIRSHLQHHGHVGISDTAGRLHYIIDGSRGAPYSTRRILEMTERLRAAKEPSQLAMEQLLPEAIDTVLDRSGIRHELKGRAYLQYILHQAILDERKLKPLSKTLYPETASHFRAQSSQVDRDIRYTFSCASQASPWPESLSTGNTARISWMCSEVKRELRRQSQKEEPPQDAVAAQAPAAPQSGISARAAETAQPAGTVS